MAQHDYLISDQAGVAFLADLNDLAEAIVTQNSGATEPADTFPGMVWLDTSTTPPTEKRRNQANDDWDSTLTEAGLALSGAADAAAQQAALGLEIGTDVQAFMASASQAEMEAGTEVALRAMSPLRVAQAIAALAGSGLTEGTPVTLSGTSGDFTGLPSTAKVIVGLLLGASSNAASTFLLQLGDSGGVETSGYTGAATGVTDGGTATYSASTSGVALGTTGAAADTLDAVVMMFNISGNDWLVFGASWRNGTTDVGWSIKGIKQLSATLDRVRATTAAADTLDAGSFNLFYWS